MKQSLASTNSYKNIFSIALPMSVAILIPQLSILANSVFLGNYNSSNGIVHGKEALSVAGVAGVYYLIYAMVCFGLASGMLMLMSRKAGNKDAKGVGALFSGGAQLGLMVTVVLLAVAYLFSNTFFDWSIQNLLVRELSKEFMAIRIWGLPFLFLAHLGTMLYIAVDKTRYMLYGTIGQTIINVVFDYYLIFGNGPFPELGIEGAAVASVLAEFVFFAVVFLIIIYNKSFERFEIRMFKKVQPKLLWEYFAKSSPLMMQYFVSIAAWEVFFIFIEHLGERELGASQIIRSTYGITGILVWALSNTVNSMVSNLYGQKNYSSILPLVKKVCTVSVIYSVAISFVIYLFHDSFLRLYTTDEEIIAVAKPALFIVLSASVIFSFSTIYFNAMLGIGNTKRNLAYESITIACYLIFCYVVVERMRPELWVAWTSEYVYWTVMLLLSGLYMHSKKWVPKE